MSGPPFATFVSMPLGDVGIMFNVFTLILFIRYKFVRVTFKWLLN